MAKKCSLVSRLREFGSSVDLHGVRFAVGEQSGSAVHRAVWSVGLAASLAFLTYFFTTRVTYYLHYNTSTMIEYDTEDIPLPSLTVCAHNFHVNVSKLTPSDVILNSEHVGNFPLNVSNVLRSSDGDFFVREDAREFFRKLSGNTSLIFSSDAERYFGKESATLADAISGQCDSSELCLNWRPVVSVLGNANIKEPLQRIDEYNVFDFHVRVSKSRSELGISGVCGVFHGRKCHWRRNWTTSGFCDTFTAHGYMRLNIDSEQLVRDALHLAPPLSEGRSVDIFINHNGNTRPTWRGGSGVDKTYDGTYQTVMVARAIRVLRQGSPYGPRCGGNEGVGVQYNGLYGHVKCHQWCSGRCGETVSETVGCRSSLHQSASLPLCTSQEDVEIHGATLGNVLVPGSCAYNCAVEHCPVKGCDQRVFHTAVLPKDGAPGQIAVDVIASDAADLMTLHEVPLYPLDSLLAELGGTMGLFVGMSLLTILHCAEFLLQELLNVITCKSDAINISGRLKSSRVRRVSIAGKPQLSGEQGGEQGGEHQQLNVELLVKSYVDKNMTSLRNEMKSVTEKLQSLQHDAALLKKTVND